MANEGVLGRHELDEKQRDDGIAALSFAQQAGLIAG